MINKKITKLFAILSCTIVACLCYASLPVRYATWHTSTEYNQKFKTKYTNLGQVCPNLKNWALFSQILLDEYGDRGVCKLLYYMREKNNIIGTPSVAFSCDSTYLLRKENIYVSDTERNRYIAKILDDNDYPNTLINAILRQTNDTIYVFPEPVLPLRRLLSGKTNVVTMGGLLFPTNLRDSIMDSTEWEQAALNSIKQQIQYLNNYKYHLIESGEIPDSLKNKYKLYLEHHL